MAGDVLGVADGDFRPTLYALSSVVYAERADQILLLKRAGGALAGQWFLPGGAVEADELPEDAARRELFEESGLRINGELTLVGAYPIWVYGGDCLQLSYRGRVDSGDVSLSHEHDDQLWVDPTEMSALLTDEAIASIALGDDRVTQLGQRIRTDLHRYLRLIGRG